jgi:cysteine desulfurase
MAGIFNISLPGVSNKEDLQIALDLDGVQVSSTSACHSGVIIDSPVLKAMGLPEARRNSSIRIGMSRLLTVEATSTAAKRLCDVLGRLV